MKIHIISKQIKLDSVSMLIECPHCTTKYTLSSVAIGSEGRQMKCAKCNEEWFQAPEDIDTINKSIETDNISTEQADTPLSNADLPDVNDELSKLSAILNDEVTIDDELGEEKEDPRDLEDETEGNITADETTPATIDPPYASNEDSIPDSVKPMTEDVIVSPPQPNTEKPQTSGIYPIFMSIIVASFIILALFASALIFKGKIIKTMPFTAGLYHLIGIETPLKGEGFVIENLNAVITKQEDQTEYIVVEGRIVNMTNTAMKAPTLIATLKTKDGKESDSWLIDPPSETINPGEGFSFTSDYPTLPENTGSVNLTFSPELNF